MQALINNIDDLLLLLLLLLLLHARTHARPHSRPRQTRDLLACTQLSSMLQQCSAQWTCRCTSSIDQGGGTLNVGIISL